MQLSYLCKLIDEQLIGIKGAALACFSCSVVFPTIQITCTISKVLFFIKKKE